MSDRIQSPDHFYSVILHELGHYIGLSHKQDLKYFHTLMYPKNSSEIRKEITRIDLQQFCDIYACDIFKREEILNDQQHYQLYLPK